MTTSGLIEKLRAYLVLERRQQKDNRDKIRALLKKLKKRQSALKEKLKKDPDAKTRKRIKRDLKVLRTQRRKGVKLYRAIDRKK